METLYSLPETVEIQKERYRYQFIGVVIIIAATALSFTSLWNQVIVVFTLIVYFGNKLIQHLTSDCYSKAIVAFYFEDTFSKVHANKIKIFKQRQKNIAKFLSSPNEFNIGFNMIQNEHQYKISQGKIKEIEQFLEQLYKEKSSLHPRQFKMRENGLQGILAEIQEEIKKYNALKEKPTVIEIKSFAEIPVALIKARIASGMTQKDLADKLGMKEQQIQRYEANQYGSAGFHRLAEVAEALEVTLNNSLLTLRS